MKQLNRFRWFALCAMMFGFALVLAPQFARPVKAASTQIDHFDELLDVVAQLPQPAPNPNPNSGNVTAPSALGGQRDLWTTVTGSAGSEDISSHLPLSPSKLSWSGDTGTSGQGLVQWDGTAGYTTVPGNFASVQDLSSGNTIGGIVITFTSNDQSVPMTFRLYGKGTGTPTPVTNPVDRCSQLTLNTPGNGLTTNNIAKVMYFPFANFTTACPGYTALSNPGQNNVWAVELFLDSGIKQAVDMTIDIVEANNIDFGDDPQSYGTKNFANSLGGPGHYIPSSGVVKLGALIDAELDGQPTPNAWGDNGNSQNDEDGVVKTPSDSTLWNPGNSPKLDITVSDASGNGGCLTGWFDWNNDGSFDDLTEVASTLSNVFVSSGTATYTINIPGGATNTGGVYYTRFRIIPAQNFGAGYVCDSVNEPVSANDVIVGSGATRSPTHFSNGEVEDYKLTNGTPTALDLASFSAKAQANKVNLKWNTASELNTLGFNVLRKQGKNWNKLNADTIQAKNLGSNVGSSYSYTDTVKKLGKTYRYKLEVLNSDGTTQFSKIVKVQVAK